MKTKVCTECKQEKNIDQYDHKRGKLRSNCKSCVSKYTKQHYKNNKKYYLEKATISRRRARERRQRFLFEYYNTHSCVDCGEKDPVVLEFDHIGEKYKGIAIMVNRGLSMERLKKEIAKCEVVCANCHKRRTAMKFKWYKNPAVAE